MIYLIDLDSGTSDSYLSIYMARDEAHKRISTGRARNIELRDAFYDIIETIDAPDGDEPDDDAPVCADCGDHGDDVVEDSYPLPLCQPCTQRRINAGCDEAERSAYRDATGVS